MPARPSNIADCSIEQLQELRAELRTIAKDRHWEDLMCQLDSLTFQASRDILVAALEMINAAIIRRQVEQRVESKLVELYDNAAMKGIATNDDDEDQPSLSMAIGKSSLLKTSICFASAALAEQLGFSIDLRFCAIGVFLVWPLEVYINLRNSHPLTCKAPSLPTDQPSACATHPPALSQQFPELVLWQGFSQLPQDWPSRLRTNSAPTSMASPSQEDQSAPSNPAPSSGTTRRLLHQVLRLVGYRKEEAHSPTQTSAAQPPTETPH